MEKADRAASAAAADSASVAVHHFCRLHYHRLGDNFLTRCNFIGEYNRLILRLHTFCMEHIKN